MAHALEIAYLNEGDFDYSGWLSTRRRKSDEWAISFFVLKGVYLAVLQGKREGNADLQGPLKAAPEGFKPDFEWLWTCCDSDSNISGGKLNDGEDLEFSVEKSRWTKKNLDIQLRAESEKDKKEWMEALTKQLAKIKEGEIKKPRAEDVSKLARSGSGYSSLTGQIDMDQLKAQAVEEVNYVRLLFSRFVDEQHGATGIAPIAFQELLLSLGLGEGLSDEELQAFVKEEFEKADKSGNGQVEFDEFVSTYNRLVDLQKEKLAATATDGAKEYVVGKSSDEFELVPQNATEGLVINPGWVKESKYSLLLRENILSWSSDDFTCRDAENKVVIRCEGKTLSLGSDIKGYDASTGDLLFHLEEIYFRVTKTYLIKGPDGKIVATLRRKVFSFTPDITVYNGPAMFNWRGKTENQILYQMDGSLIQWQFKIRNGKGETVAYADEKLAWNTLASLALLQEKNTYQLDIAPGVDASLMAALTIACDCAVNDV